MLQSRVGGEKMELDGNFQTRTGQLFASVGKGSPLEHVRVEVGREDVRVSRHNMVYEDILATKDIVERRAVELERGEEGLGIAIQGGLDFKLPVSIDTVFDNSPASRSGVIEREDVLLEVNGELVWGKTHEEATRLLRSAGLNVTLTIAKLVDKDVVPERDGERGGGDYWIPFTSVPLKLATVSLYTHSTAIMRPTTFQVISCDERSKVSLHCDEGKRGQMEEWMTVIRNNISILLTTEMRSLNEERDEEDKLVLMGWAHELLASTPHTKVWRRKFLTLKKSQLQIYDSYPGDVHEWFRPVHTHTLTEVTCRVLKPHELENQRAHSLLLSSGKGYTHIFSFETRQGLREWTQALHQHTVDLVQQIQALQFGGQWKQRDIDFCLDLTQGFIVRDRDTMVVKWKKPFSWLRCSSDDNHSWLRLEFGNPRAQHTETQEIELEELHLAVVAMECFMLAKLVTLDPGYLTQTDFIAEPSP